MHVTEAFEGGVATWLRHVLPALAREGLDVTLVCSPRHPERARRDLHALQAAGVRIRVLPMRRSVAPLCDAKAWWTISNMLGHDNVDLLHTHGFKGGVLGRLAAAGRTGVATVHTPHCLPFTRADHWLARWATRRVERSLAVRTDCLQLVSESERLAAVRAGIRPRCMAVVPNALPPLPSFGIHQVSAAKRRLGLPESHLTVAACCRLVPYKGLPQLLAAFGRLCRDLPALICLVTGGGPQAGVLADLARSLPVPETIRFLGHREDIEDILPAVDLLVQCSKAEGMPYIVLEAMNRAIPVVASCVPGHTDLIDDRRTGLLYPCGQVDALEDCLQRCLTDAGLRHTLGQAAQAHVHEHHRLDSQVEALLNVYRAALATGPASVVRPCERRMPINQSIRKESIR
jgi:glycosyltransferase involved in cell wall biosynthesis